MWAEVENVNFVFIIKFRLSFDINFLSLRYKQPSYGEQKIKSKTDITKKT